MSNPSDTTQTPVDNREPVLERAEEEEKEVEDEIDFDGEGSDEEEDVETDYSDLFSDDDDEEEEDEDEDNDDYKNEPFETRRDHAPVCAAFHFSFRVFKPPQITTRRSRAPFTFRKTPS